MVFTGILIDFAPCRPANPTCMRVSPLCHRSDMGLEIVKLAGVPAARDGASCVPRLCLRPIGPHCVRFQGRMLLMPTYVMLANWTDDPKSGSWVIASIARIGGICRDAGSK
jgi:hypothetical protein